MRTLVPYSSCRSILLALVCVLTSASLAAAQAPRVNPDEVLTEEVVTRILGLEKEELQVPPDAAPAESELMQRKRQLMAEGVAAFRAGNGDAALAKFEDVQRLDAALPPADVFLARLCFAVNDQNFVRLGLTVLNRAADKHPEAPEPYLMFGQLALLEGRLTDAYVMFEKAGQVIDARSATLGEAKQKLYRKNVYAGRVGVCEQRQNWDRGLIEMTGWIALDPKDPNALFRQGRLIYMKDPKDDRAVSEARKLFEEAYEAATVSAKNPDDLPVVPPAELALLELQTANGEPAKARLEIERLDRRAAEWQQNRREGSRVYSTISQWYLGQGEFKQAEAYAAKATELDKDSQALKQLTAVLHYYARDPQAEVEFAQLNAEQPDDFFAANFLALALADATTSDGRPDDAKRTKAIRIAEMNARLNPRSPVALATLGWAYFNAARTNEAAQLFGSMEQQQNLQVSPDTAYYMAKTFAALPSSQFPNALGRSKSLLELAVQSNGVFRYRPEAERWLNALNGTAPLRNNDAAVPPINLPRSGTSNLVDPKQPEAANENKDKS